MIASNFPPPTAQFDNLIEDIPLSIYFYTILCIWGSFVSNVNVSCVSLQCSRRREVFQGGPIVYFQHTGYMSGGHRSESKRCAEPLTEVHERWRR